MDGYDVMMEEFILRKNKGLSAVDPRSFPTWSDEQKTYRDKLRLEVDEPYPSKKEERDEY